MVAAFLIVDFGGLLALTWEKHLILHFINILYGFHGLWAMIIVLSIVVSLGFRYQVAKQFWSSFWFSSHGIPCGRIMNFNFWLLQCGSARGRGTHYITV